MLPIAKPRATIRTIEHQRCRYSQALLKAFLEQTTHITESLYADEFNMDLAQAINELQHYCDEGVLEKTLINNETCYIKAKQLSFI